MPRARLPSRPARGGWVPRAAGAPVTRAHLAAAALVAVLALAAAATWWALTHARAATPPVVLASGVPVPGSPSPAPGRGSSAPPAPEVVVHVTGLVRRPGVVRLPAGARVADALKAAGGLRPGASAGTLNLARRLADGEQVAVGVVPGPDAGGASAADASSGPLDLNTATVDQLDGLPGVGPVLAARIVAWRTQHGRFTSVDELGEVSGVGDRRLADLTPLVRV